MQTYLIINGEKSGLVFEANLENDTVVYCGLLPASLKLSDLITIGTKFEHNLSEWIIKNIGKGSKYFPDIDCVFCNFEHPMSGDDSMVFIPITLFIHYINEGKIKIL